VSRRGFEPAPANVQLNEARQWGPTFSRQSAVISMITSTLALFISVATLLVTAVLATSKVSRSAPNSPGRSLGIALTCMLFVFTPPALAICVAAIHPRLPAFVWYVDLPLPFLLLPSVLASLIGWWLTSRSDLSATMTRAIAVWAWAGFFGALNTANFCNPGWCGRYGFPFPYFTWSDAMITWNDKPPDNLNEGSLVLNILVFFGVTALIYRHLSRGEGAERGATSGPAS
jgi:hypothetical protein